MLTCFLSIGILGCWIFAWGGLISWRELKHGIGLGVFGFHLFLIAMLLYLICEVNT